MTLLGRTSVFGKSKSLPWTKGDADSVADMAGMGVPSQTKILCCEMSVSPCSTMTMTPSTSLMTSEATTCFEDGELDDDSDMEGDLRMSYTWLRTNSCIGMPVWDASRADAAVDTKTETQRDICSFDVPTSHVAVTPTSPPPATLASMFVGSPHASNVDGHIYGDQVDSHASPNGDCSGRGLECDRAYVPRSQETCKRIGKVDASGGVDGGRKTTICFRNIPNNYSTKMVLELMDQSGFKDCYDFIYVPHDFKRLPSLVNVGYFFVNFISHDIAVSALEKLVGFKSWAVKSGKVLDGTWAVKTQGKRACRAHCKYWTKYFTHMHQDIPSECKPMMFDFDVM